MQELTQQEFINKYRPDGKGKIQVGNLEPIEFEEIICDSCNIEIKNSKENPEDKVVFVEDNNAYCKNCFDKYYSNKYKLLEKAQDFLNRKIDRVKFVYSDGKKENRRIFISNLNRICVIAKGKRNSGYPLKEMSGLINIEEITSRTSESDKYINSINKAINLLENSGLWSDLLKEFKLCKEIGFNKLKEAERVYWEKQEGLSYEENQKFNKEKVKQIDKRLIDETNHIKSNILFHWAEPLKIKKMNFGGWRNEENLKRIKEVLVKKEKLSVNGQTSYDVSFEYNPELNKAWYSEEFRNCGNGHYYLALNETHAVFYEDD